MESLMFDVIQGAWHCLLHGEVALNPHHTINKIQGPGHLLKYMIFNIYLYSDFVAQIPRNPLGSLPLDSRPCQRSRGEYNFVYIFYCCKASLALDIPADYLV